MKKPYPSDITREQFATIQPMLERARKKTKPKTIYLYDILGGLLNLTSTQDKDIKKSKKLYSQG